MLPVLESILSTFASKPEVKSSDNRSRSSKNAHASGRKFRTEGPFRCSKCPVELSSKRHRRRHTKLLHCDSENKPQVLNEHNHARSSGDSKQALSRSLAARKLREQPKKPARKEQGTHELEQNSNKLEQKPLQDVMLKERELLQHHKQQYAKNRLCKRDDCTEATAKGVKNLQSSLRVRAKDPSFHCSVCGGGFSQQNALRQHTKCSHSTKRALAESLELFPPSLNSDPQVQIQAYYNSLKGIKDGNGDASNSRSNGSWSQADFSAALG